MRTPPLGIPHSFDAPASLTSSGMASLVADSDDSFASIPVRVPPAGIGSGPAGASISVPGSSNSGSSFEGVLGGLMAEERFEEALACKLHLEAVTQLARTQVSTY